jgi:ADP-heptose:LPS heptosyltransferase
VVPALRGLRAALPGHRLVLLGPRALAPLVADLVDEVLDVEGRRAVPDALPELGPVDVAVNLHGRGPQSHARLLALAPRRVIAFARPELGVAGPAWRDGEHEVARWCRLVGEAGIDADPRRLEIAVPAARAPEVARGATLLHPGAASAARRWPVERWAAVARSERRAGRRVVVTGSAAERPLAEAITAAAGVPAAAVLAGTTDVLGLAAAVAACARVVCGDTGVAHLATALGTPSLVLFGPTAPAEWAPPGDRAIHRVLWAGSRGDPHAEALDGGLAALSVTAVLRELRHVRRARDRARGS